MPGKNAWDFTLRTWHIQTFCLAHNQHYICRSLSCGSSESIFVTVIIISSSSSNSFFAGMFCILHNLDIPSPASCQVIAVSQKSIFSYMYWSCCFCCDMLRIVSFVLNIWNVKMPEFYVLGYMGHRCFCQHTFMLLYLRLG